MNMKKYYIAVLLVASLAMLFTACSKMNDLHDKYLREGETIYLAKMDSLALHSGRHRILVEYWISDPKAKKCKVEWDLGEKSAIYDVEKTVGKENPGSFYIENLDETTVSFDFTLMTENMEYPSLKTSAAVTVYGDRYVSTLMGPTIKSIAYADSKVTLTLASHYENVVGYIFNYPSSTGGTATKRADISTLKIVLENAADHGTVEYAAVYMPTEDSIDEYTTDFAQIDY